MGLAALIASLLRCTAAAATCEEIRAMLGRGMTPAEVMRATGMTVPEVRACIRQPKPPVVISPVGPAPHGAAGPAPHGAAGPAPHGAAGPPPHGAAGPPPHGAAGPAPFGDAPR